MKLIDAEALLKLYRPWPVHTGAGLIYVYMVTERDILNVPTINPEDLRPKGRWVNGICSNCGQVDFSKPKFCPNCGAEMEREEVEKS